MTTICVDDECKNSECIERKAVRFVWVQGEDMSAPDTWNCYIQGANFDASMEYLAVCPQEDNKYMFEVGTCGMYGSIIVSGNHDTLVDAITAAVETFVTRVAPEITNYTTTLEVL